MQPSWISDRPENTNLEENIEILLPVNFSLNSVQRLQRKSRKCLGQLRGHGGNLGFLINPKNANLVEDVEILLLVKICWIPFSGCRENIENVSVNSRLGQSYWFSDWPENTNLVTSWDLASYSFSLNTLKRSQRRSKLSQPIRGQGSHLGFPICLKKTHTW